MTTNTAPSAGQRGLPGLDGEDATTTPPNVRIVTANTTAITTDDVILVDVPPAGAVSVTLPVTTGTSNSLAPRRPLYIKRIDNNRDAYAFVSTTDGIGGDDNNIALKVTSSQGQSAGEGVCLIYDETNTRWTVLTADQNTEANDANRFLVFPGDRFQVGNRVRWTGRALAIGRGYSPADDVDTFQNINMPAVGTLVPHSTGGTRATTADGFLVNDWETLWYLTDINSAASGTFTTVAYNDNWMPNDADVLLAQKVGDSSGKHKWGDGLYSPNPVDDVPDFWRATDDPDLIPASEGNAGLLPQNAGATTYQGGIHHQGKVMIGAGQRITGADTDSWRTPVALLDVNRWNQLRTGGDFRSAEDVIYATGNISASNDFNSAAGSHPVNDGQPKFYFGHLNQTQGFIVSHDGIGHRHTSASGGLTKWHIGHTRRTIHKGFTANQTYEDLSVNQTMTAGQVMNKRWLDSGRVIATERMIEAAADRFEWRWQVRVSGAERLHMRIIPTETTGAATTLFFENNLNDDKISLWGGPGSNANARYSLGIRGNTFLYKAPLAAMHAFNFGGAATNQIEIRNSGDVRIFDLPVAANNAAAPGPVGRLYRSNNGNLNVKF